MNIKIHTHTHISASWSLKSLRQEAFTELPTTLQLNKQVLFPQFTSEAYQGSAQDGPGTQLFWAQSLYF